MSDNIINKVANSSLITINLEEYFPKQKIMVFDIKPFLFKELILKEKDFRSDLKQHDWKIYQNAIVLIQCSVDCILPIWAYILIASHLQGIAADVFAGTQKEYLQLHYDNAINNMDTDKYQDGRIIVHGCSQKPVPLSAFISITNKLQNKVKSLMFGEACSTVPIFKKMKNEK